MAWIEAGIDPNIKLDSPGFLSDKSFASGPVIAIRDPANAEGVVAFNSTCTHQGCSVDWESSEFACPCHGSKFSANGEVTEGPAEEALATYEARIEGAQVLVRTAQFTNPYLRCVHQRDRERWMHDHTNAPLNRSVFRA